LIYICIPTHNEQQTVGVVLWKLRQVLTEYPRDYQLLVADDASTDKTQDVLEPYTRVLPLTLFRSEKRQGYAASLEMLLREAARRSEYPKRDVVVTLQADFSDEPDDLIPLIKRLEAGADVAVGTKVSATKETRVRRWARRLSSFFARRQAWPEGVVTPFDSYRAYRLHAVKRAIEEREGRRLLRYDGWAGHAELLRAVLPHARRVDVVNVDDRVDRLQRPRREKPFAAALQVRAMMSDAEPADLVGVEELDRVAATASRSRERTQPANGRGNGRERSQPARDRRPGRDRERPEARSRSGRGEGRSEGNRSEGARSEGGRTGRGGRGGRTAQQAGTGEQARPAEQARRGQGGPAEVTAEAELPPQDAVAADGQDVAGVESAPTRPKRKRRRRGRGGSGTGGGAEGQAQAESPEAQTSEGTDADNGEANLAEAGIDPATGEPRKRRRRGGRRGGRGRRRVATNGTESGEPGEGPGHGGGDGADDRGGNEGGGTASPGGGVAAAPSGPASRHESLSGGGVDVQATAGPARAGEARPDRE
jgi:hypothetical protein